MKARLTTRDFVRVYQDPITKQKPEGTAMPHKFIGCSDDLERWMVHFCDDAPGAYYERLVDPKDKLRIRHRVKR